MKTPDWIISLKYTIPKWLEKIQVTNQPGRFYPCLDGRTKIGSKAALGFSCFALKIYYILDLWESLNDEIKKGWINFILSFQRNDTRYKGAFVDSVILNNCDPIKNRVIRIITNSGHRGISHKRATCIAETKQALATLAQVGIQSKVPFTDFPHNSEFLIEYLKKLNWAHPWGAAGQSSAIALFVANEAPKFLTKSQVKELKNVMKEFFYSIADKETGGYYIGKRPDFTQLVNGAMKVLNAYEWLNVEIPYVEKLVDTCLSLLPSAEGCHIVDVIYVLYRCSLQTQYRKRDIVNYCVNILDMIKNHCKPDGAFSYYLNHNQTNYYGAKLAKPLYQSDIHGTVLFLWAIALISALAGFDKINLKIIKP